MKYFQIISLHDKILHKKDYLVTGRTNLLASLLKMSPMHDDNWLEACCLFYVFLVDTFHRRYGKTGNFGMSNSLCTWKTSVCFACFYICKFYHTVVSQKRIILRIFISCLLMGAWKWMFKQNTTFTAEHFFIKREVKGESVKQWFFLILPTNICPGKFHSVT